MKPTFYKTNRENLIRSLSGGLFISSAYTRTQRRSDMAQPFDQESNFLYLTGIDEPDWRLVVDGVRGHSWLIAPEISEVHRIFDGGLSFDDAKQRSGVDEVIAADGYLELIRRLSKSHKLVHTVGQSPYADQYNFEVNPSTERNRQMLSRYFTTVQDCQKELARLRAIKQPEELVAIKKAVAATMTAFEAIRSRIDEYRFEYEIEADFAHVVRRRGADGCAYDSIVASGANACTLHYSANSSRVSSRQFIIMDMGAQHNGYAADITRTYAKGEPTQRQRLVHAAVETAHRRIIKLIAPSVAVESYQRDVDTIMAEALESIGLPHDTEGVRKYFPHAISHGLGIDVHDSLGSPKFFQEGMVLTVEPGIYIPEEGIGVRIEDDILVTAKGHRNLSAALATGP